MLGALESVVEQDRTELVLYGPNFAFRVDVYAVWIYQGVLERMIVLSREVASSDTSPSNGIHSPLSSRE